MLTHFYGRLLHQYLSSAFWSVFKNMVSWNWGGGGLSGMEYENERLNFLCLIKEPGR